MNTPTHEQMNANVSRPLKRRFLVALALRRKSYTQWLHEHMLAYVRECEAEERVLLMQSAASEEGVARE